MEYFSFRRTLAKEDNFLGFKCNDVITNFFCTSEITVSAGILVDSRPFFLKVSAKLSQGPFWFYLLLRT